MGRECGWEACAHAALLVRVLALLCPAVRVCLSMMLSMCEGGGAADRGGVACMVQIGWGAGSPPQPRGCRRPCLRMPRGAGGGGGGGRPGGGGGRGGPPAGLPMAPPPPPPTHTHTHPTPHPASPGLLPSTHTHIQMHTHHHPTPPTPGTHLSVCCLTRLPCPHVAPTGGVV
jgi:hypothetical protein